jgi:hypothetical protein
MSVPFFVTNIPIQEDCMNITMILAGAAVLLATVVQAQEQEREYFAAPAAYAGINQQAMMKGYVRALSSENDGVVESALAHIAMIKLNLPGGDYRAAEKRIGELARKAASVETRYKAFLVKAILDEPALFPDVTTACFYSADEFFAKVASRMNNALAKR